MMLWYKPSRTFDEYDYLTPHNRKNFCTEFCISFWIMTQFNMRIIHHFKLSLVLKQNLEILIFVSFGRGFSIKLSEVQLNYELKFNMNVFYVQSAISWSKEDVRNSNVLPYDCSKKFHSTWLILYHVWLMMQKRFCFQKSKFWLLFQSKNIIPVGVKRNEKQLSYFKKHSQARNKTSPIIDLKVMCVNFWQQCFIRSWIKHISKQNY